MSCWGCTQRTPSWWRSAEMAEAALNAGPLQGLERRERLIGLALFGPILLMVAVLLLIPVGWLLGLSVVEKDQFSLVHYARMIEYSSYYSILLTTFEISLVVTLICVLLGYPAAYLLAQMRPGLAMF